MARKSRKDMVCDAVSSVPGRVVYRAGVYKRLSSSDTKKRGDSLETQHKIIEGYISDAPDIRLCESYVDNNATGTNFERPGFQRMLADAESGKINCIIVKDLTRFGRNAIDSGYYLEKCLPSLNVRVIAVTDNYDSNDGDGGIMLPLKNIIAESYALDIGRKCRAVQRQKIIDGRFIGRMAPYGYDKDPLDCHKLMIDPVAAATVTQMFEWAGEGVSYGEITRRLNSAGIPTPSHYKQSRGIIANEKLIGLGKWQKWVVTKILRDQVYVGDMVQGKTRTVNCKEIAASPDEWICVPNTHEAIISRGLFERVQTMREQASALDASKRQSQGAYLPNMFKGKIFCDKCGRPLHRHRQNKDGSYWFRCESQWKYGKDTCVCVSVREADLKTAIIELLHKKSEVILGKFIRIDTRTSKSAGIVYDKELHELNVQLDTNSRTLKSLFESLVSGLVTDDEFGQMKLDCETKHKSMTARVSEIRQLQLDADEQRSEYRNFADAVSSVLANEKLTTEIVDNLIDKILVRPDKGFELSFKFGDEFKEDVSGQLHHIQIYPVVSG